jgi:hypothetical protein
MKDSHSPDASVQKLLRGLPQKHDDEVGVITISGRALSRSRQNVHMAVLGGIIAVPIANVQQVVPAGKGGVVRMVVSRPHEIQGLLNVRPAGLPGSGGGGSTAMMEDGETLPTDRNPVKEFVGVGTYISTDSDTITGGQGNPDATDDRINSDASPDDLQQ